MNFIQIKQKLFVNIPKPLFAILIITCVVRLIVAFLIVNFSTDFYWEYGEIAKNVQAGHGYSLYYISNNVLSFRFDSGVTSFPSALMAPGYVCFLLPFMLINNIILRNILIILTQTTLSLVSILILYKFTADYFSQRTALIASILASILPDFVYSIMSFTPTVLYHCLIVSLMAFLYKRKQHKDFYIALLFSVLTYVRFEFLLFVLIYISVQILSRQWKHAIIVFGLTVILLSPWTIRNSVVFNRFIPLSTGFGLNFYRGNNAEELGSWGNDAINKKILELPRNQSFEVDLNHLYYIQALEFISEHPFLEISNLPSKLFHLWIMSTLQERSSNILYEATSWFIFIFFLMGIFTTFSWQKHKYLYIIFIFSTIIAVIFFTLPRHQTMMRITLLPIVGAGVEYAWEFTKKLISQIGDHHQP